MKKLLKWLSSNNIRQILGVNLASLAFAVAIIVPQTNAVWSAWEVTRDVPMVTILNGPTEAGTRWPLTTFGISQSYWVGHPGVDLTAPFGSPVYPIAAGTVEWTSSISFGYGNHVFIKNSDQLQSLYAHFAKILVKPGDTVTKNTQIGLVGATGWATGNHVHLEVYQNGVPINPEDVLPELK
jgi:murein DD-endopeptidase MepM/ murein hydrolase activator NlpD